MLVVRPENSEIYRALLRRGVRFATRTAVREVAAAVRRHGAGYLRNAVQQVVNRVNFKSGNTVTRFQSNLGPREREAPATVERPVKKNRATELFPEMNNNQPTGYAQRVDYYKKKGGKYVSKRQKVMSTLEAHVQPIVERFQRCSNLVSSDTAAPKRGAFSLLAGPQNATDWLWPVYMFDLTGVKNANIGSTNQYPHIAYGLRQTSATNNFYYAAIGHDASDNITQMSTWVVEKLARASPDLSSVPVAGMSSMLDNFKVKMTAYGCSKQPTEVYLELWRFVDEKLVPDALVTTAGLQADPKVITTATVEQDRLNGFWQYQLSKMIGTQNNDQVDYNQGKGVDIKRLWTFKFGPSSSDNEGVGNAVRNLTYDHQFNRYLKLDWDAGDNLDVPEVSIGNPDVFIPTGNANSVHSHPNQKSRMFLVVRADVQQTYATAWDTLTEPQKDVVLDEFMPQFDLQIRRFRQMVHT